MELSRHLRSYSRTIAGKEQLLIGAVAKALEVIPRQLCDNAGFDATNILNKLRQKHAQGNSKSGGAFPKVACIGNCIILLRFRPLLVRSRRPEGRYFRQLRKLRVGTGFGENQRVDRRQRSCLPYSIRRRNY